MNEDSVMKIQLSVNAKSYSSWNMIPLFSTHFRTDKSEWDKNPQLSCWQKYSNLWII